MLVLRFRRVAVPPVGVGVPPASAVFAATAASDGAVGRVTGLLARVEDVISGAVYPGAPPGVALAGVSRVVRAAGRHAARRAESLTCARAVDAVGHVLPPDAVCSFQTVG